METFPRPFNDDYELLGLLGKGGMGSKVYKALQVKLNRVVALKVLDVNTADEESGKRFESEAQAMKEFSHSNLVTIFDYGHHEEYDKKQVYLAMTFVDGKPLSELLKERGKLSLKEVKSIAWQVASGLRYSHERGVIHRDIKPSNIMVKSDGSVFVIDFGISLSLDSQRHTQAGMTMGTPEYMSPEQCQNKNITNKSDIYSLGIVIYEMLSGDPPFSGGASLAILNKHLKEKPAPLHEKNPSVLPSLEKIVDKCLEKKPDDRYNSFAEFINDIRDFDTDVASGRTARLNMIISRLTLPEKAAFGILCALPVLLILVILLLVAKSVPEPPKSVVLLKAAAVSGVAGGSGSTAGSDSIGVRLFDGDLATAWRVKKEIALKANGGVFLSVKFAKPTLITNLGIAIGDQSDWDNFSKFSKPKEVWVRYVSPSAKGGVVNEQSSRVKIILDDRFGVQYPSWNPVEVTDLMFELKSMQNDRVSEDLAISELRLLGMEM
ncbi:hypothetical protein AGMMS49938_07120 [Fibrobacterales bacterium]|nr:hypothetical protein AGMMS49938_07120 [Fibrobacterales bacterium]